MYRIHTTGAYTIDLTPEEYAELYRLLEAKVTYLIEVRKNIWLSPVNIVAIEKKDA